MKSTFSIEKFPRFAEGFRWKDQDASRARIFSWSGDQPDGGTDCQFRHGVCLQHKPKGDKHIGKSKKWGKVKSEYGWIHSSKVRYTCKTVSRGLSFARLEDEWSDGRSPGLSANSKGIKGLTDDISGQRAENEMYSL